MNAPQTQILIADNDAPMAMSLKELLAPQADRIWTARTVAEAGACLKHHGPDLLLIDLGLLDSESNGLIDQIRTRGAPIPILLMTAQGNSGTVVHAARQWAYACFKKPFEPEALIRKVGTALELHRRLQAPLSAGPPIEGAALYSQYLLENSPDMMYALDARGHFTYANPAAARLLGCRPEALIGKPYQSVIHPQDLPKAHGVFNERRTRQREPNISQLLLARGPEAEPPPDAGRDAQDDPLVVEVSAVGVYDRPPDQRGKRFLGTYGVARNVSRRRSLEIELRRAEKLETVQTLVGGIAHDFNNLLMAIQGNTSLLLHHCEPGADYQIGKLKQIEALVNSGAELTELLVGFARGGRYQLQSVNLNDIITQVVRQFTANLDAIQVEVDLQPGVSMLRADPEQMERVFLTLLTNARDAMPHGGILRITTRLWELAASDPRFPGCAPGDYIRIQVADTGVGMDGDTLSRVFVPFFTTKTRGRGTGLGLAAAYGIIQHHGGTIRVASVPGKGSLFTILLPVILSYEPPSSPPEDHRR